MTGGGGVQFFIYEETVLGRIILAEYEVSPYEVENIRRVLEESVRIRRQDSPGRKFGWQEHVIDNQPTPGAPFQ